MGAKNDWETRATNDKNDRGAPLEKNSWWKENKLKRKTSSSPVGNKRTTITDMATENLS